LKRKIFVSFFKKNKHDIKKRESNAMEEISISKKKKKKKKKN